MKEIIIFLLFSILVSAGLYQDALWGGAILAPVDLAADSFEHFAYVDESADGIPDNHQIIDQFTYDLPLQHVIFEAYSSGQIPWWDPYTYGGRPLLADAHINGTDPIRVACYLALPFELAYNWNYILRGVATSLGMFLLLRTFQTDPIVSGVFGISFSIAGWFTLYFGHPWIQGSFLYYPFLWIVWAPTMIPSFHWRLLLGSVFCTAIFYSGNLQSHTYLPIFGICILCGEFIHRREKFGQTLLLVALCGIIAALLASPILINQVEFYLLGERSASSPAPWHHNLLASILNFMSPMPWSTGGFKTLDIGKILSSRAVAYHLFGGVAVSFFAIIGLIYNDKSKWNVERFQAIMLIAVYLLLMATPLKWIIYPRSAALAGMGLVVLAGFGVQQILKNQVIVHKAVLWIFGGLTVGLGFASSLVAWLIFPLYESKVRQLIAAKDAANSSLHSMPALRSAQIDNFAAEVSLENPAVLFTSLITIGLCLMVGRGLDRGCRSQLVGLIVISIIPLLIFHARFRPKHDIALWEQIRDGGLIHQHTSSQMVGGKRLLETTDNLGGMLFPNAMPSMFGVHEVGGYSALQPPSIHRRPEGLGELSPAWISDWIFDAGQLYQLASPESGGSRFRNFDTGEAAPVVITSESLNHLTVELPLDCQHMALIRTDTYYPGWHSENAEMEKYKSIFTLIKPTVGRGEITLAYRPTGLVYGPYLVTFGMVLFFSVATFSILRKRRL